MKNFRNVLNVTHILLTPNKEFLRMEGESKGNSIIVFHSWFFTSLHIPLHKKWSFPFKISSVNVARSTVSYGFTFTEEIFNGKRHFLSSVFWPFWQSIMMMMNCFVYGWRMKESGQNCLFPAGSISGHRINLKCSNIKRRKWSSWSQNDRNGWN